MFLTIYLLFLHFERGKTIRDCKRILRFYKCLTSLSSEVSIVIQSYICFFFTTAMKNIEKGIKRIEAFVKDYK